MVISISSSNSDKKHIVLLTAIFILFLFSVGLIVFGLMPKKNEEVAYRELKTKEVKEETSVSQYFEEEFSGSANGDFLSDDPFTEVCESTAGDEQVSFSFGTVCLR